MQRAALYNAPLLAASASLRAALFPIPVITLFWKDQIGMSLTDIMWLQAIFGATAVVCEFPSGYVADRLGYRRSLVIGALFWLAGWLAYALGTTFAGMVLAETQLGVGLAFISGADSALLFVSVEGGKAACARRRRRASRHPPPSAAGCMRSRRACRSGFRSRLRRRTWALSPR
jgi:MFS family permease